MGNKYYYKEKKKRKEDHGGFKSRAKARVFKCCLKAKSFLTTCGKEGERQNTSAATKKALAYVISTNCHVHAKLDPKVLLLAAMEKECL